MIMSQYSENSEKFDTNLDLDTTITAVGEGDLSIATAFSLRFHSSGTSSNAGGVGAAQFSGPSAFAFVGADDILYDWHPVIHLSAAFDAGTTGSVLALRISMDMLPLAQELRTNMGGFPNSHFYVTNELGQVLASTEDPEVFMSPTTVNGSTQLTFRRIWDVAPAVKRDHFIDLLRVQERVTAWSGETSNSDYIIGQPSDGVRVDLEISKSSGAPLILIATTSSKDFRDAALTSLVTTQVAIISPTHVTAAMHSSRRYQLMKHADENLEASRRASREWYVAGGVGGAGQLSAFFNTANMCVGIGILALPKALEFSGWALGITSLLLIAVLTFYSVRMIVAVSAHLALQDIDDYDASQHGGRVVTPGYAEVVRRCLGPLAEMILTALIFGEVITHCLHRRAFSAMLPKIGQVVVPRIIDWHRK
ncbi:amino acid transporter, putative [Perkinsus marinus ATCC 50983]|uniref:Amino acid transporter, putative n=1 Tax=Perkinsus marinus (strain ATCC 50983 / TXsc) TaxID=423536 RepID=C5L3R5_PERM5|nr:amino acid transporter, putative [Perkinsus marinus ATCC 50983]EER08644.1 amino acid transporter, putative [Perkinsus marinus ATCC 50983]|eukprot:XP_002776828.1 amino acid transporter, putative [Perkinsus marinus ATCC 50983]